MTGPALGHEFTNPALLREALTHRSAVPRSHGRRPAVRSNERLEFVGDRVLGLAMVEWLVELFPDEPEGLLARRQADLVAEHQLAAIGTGLGLADMLIVAPNEARAGVGHGTAVVADATEAVLGAIYYDGGLEAARRFVRTHWAECNRRPAEAAETPEIGLEGIPGSPQRHPAALP